jgi:uncharacterized protein (TIRG00374 family)
MRKTLQLVIGLVISALALVLAFYDSDPAQVWASLRAANYLYLVPGMACVWLGLYLRAASWRTILGNHLPFRRVFDAMNEGYLLNNLLPFRLGEFGRAYLISHGTSLSAYQALSSVVVERVIDLLMAVVLLLAFLPFVAAAAWAGQVASASVVLGLVGLGTLVLVARNQARVIALARAVLSRLNFSWLHPDRWIARLESLLAGLSLFQDPRRAFIAAGWSLLAWISAAFGTWFLLLAFLPGAGLPMSFVVLTVVALGAAVPSAPGSAGVFEATVVYVLGFFSVPRELALSFGLTFHVLQIALTVLLGGLALAREGETFSHLARSAQALVTRTEKPAAPAA